MRITLLAVALAVAGCAAQPASETTSSDEDFVASAATITFAADWSNTVSGSLVAGGQAVLAYDPARLPACRGNLANGPGWSITAYYRLNGGAIGSVPVAGHLPYPNAQPIVPLAGAGDLEVWFENTSVWGCDAFDSAWGKNYYFQVAASPGAPGWIGNANVDISRATCNGPCDFDLRPLANGFTFDTWARQRAAIASTYFEVWKQGTTDFDNPNLWKQLDVEVFTRFGGQGPFTMSYVSFDRRLGNNARYAFDLRAIDPLGAQSTLTDKAQCPSFPTTITPDGQYVQTTIELYFSVNGVELRPAPGAVYSGSYQNYRGIYATCEAP